MIATELSGKRALVTGGASGIGLATVRVLLQSGVKVAVNHLPDDGEAAVVLSKLSAAGAIAAPGDVADPDDAARMVREAIEALGGLDILINNAGTSGVREPIAFHDLEAMTEAFWAKLLSTNLLGAFRCVKAAAGALKESQGAVVNTASVAGFGGAGSSLAYAASKAALINLTRNLAKALAPEVRVNAVAPGLTRTPWTAAWPEERINATLTASALRRMVEPEDVAQAMIFLCTNRAITGQTLVVDCGRGL